MTRFSKCNLLLLGILLVCLGMTSCRSSSIKAVVVSNIKKKAAGTSDSPDLGSASITLASAIQTGFLNLDLKNSAVPLFVLAYDGAGTISYAVVESSQACSAISSYPLTDIPTISSLTLDGSFKVCGKLMALSGVGEPTYFESAAFVRDTSPPTLSSISLIGVLVGDELITDPETGSVDPLISVSQSGGTGLFYSISNGAPTGCFTNTVVQDGRCVNPNAVTSSQIPRAVDVLTNANDYFICVKSVDLAGNASCGASPYFERTGNQTPSITSISDLSINKNSATGAIYFTLDDPDGALGSCAGTTLTAVSSQTSLVTNVALSAGRAGVYPNCYLDFSPVNDQIGTTTITVTVSDGSLSAQRSFVLTVSDTVPVNEPQALSFVDVDFDTGELGGTALITAATSEVDVLGYNLYWGSSPSVKQSATPIASVLKTDSLSISVPMGSSAFGRTHLLVYSYNAVGEMATGKNVALSDKEILAPSGINYNAGVPDFEDIQLTWTDSSTGETGFKVERSTTNNTSFSVIATPAANAASYNDTSSVANTTYYYRVRAYVNDGSTDHFGPYSSEVQVILPAAPGVPGSPQATGGNTVSNLSWTVGSNATSYNVYWSTVSGTGTAGTKISLANVLSYPHTGRTNGTPYYYVITAQNASGESAASAEVTATPSAGGPPTGFGASSSACGQLGISTADALGQGTQKNPYLICNKTQLADINNLCGGSQCSYLYFLQMADIDMNAQSFVPFGLYGGEYDGNHFKISNLNVNRAAGAGFINTLEGGAFVKNLSFEDLTLNSISGSSGVVIESKGDAIINVHVLGTSSIKGASAAGGMVGNASSGALVYGCSVIASIEGLAGGTATIGGLVGMSAYLLRVHDSSASGSLTNLTNAGSTGGILGRGDYQTHLKNVKSEMLTSVPDQSTHSVGGLIGRNESGSINVQTSVSLSTIANQVNPRKGAILGYLGDGTYTSENKVFYSLANLPVGISEVGDTWSAGAVTAAATAVTTDNAMKSRATFLGLLPFGSHWYIDDGNDYPQSVYGLNACAQARNFEGYTLYTDIGAGTVEDPYLICTAQQLNEVSSGCGSLSSSACSSHFALGASFDMNDLGLTPHQMIGSGGNEFQGTFDGRRNNIENLEVGTLGVDTYVGLFHSVRGNNSFGYSVRNLGLKSVAIAGKSKVGAIAGRIFNSSGYMSYVYSTGTLALSDGTLATSGGGLIGSVESAIIVRNSYSTVDITATGVVEKVGGLFGASNAAIYDSYYDGDIATVSGGSSVTYIGGLVGYGTSGLLYRSYALGSMQLTGSTVNYVGGLAGTLGGTSGMHYSFSRTTITGTANNLTHVGGMVGSHSDLIVQYCYFAGSVEQMAPSQHAFLISSSNCDSSAACVATKYHYDSTRSALGEGMIVDSSMGEIFGLSTASMKNSSNYTGWDFTNIWQTASGVNDGYPSLR